MRLFFLPQTDLHQCFLLVIARGQSHCDTMKRSRAGRAQLAGTEALFTFLWRSHDTAGRIKSRIMNSVDIRDSEQTRSLEPEGKFLVEFELVICVQRQNSQTPWPPSFIRDLVPNTEPRAQLQSYNMTHSARIESLTCGFSVCEIRVITAHRESVRITWVNACETLWSCLVQWPHSR